MTSNNFLVQYYQEADTIYIDLDARARHDPDENVATYLRRTSSSYLFLTWELDHGKMLCAEFILCDKFWETQNVPELALDLDWLALEAKVPELRQYDLRSLLRQMRRTIES